MTGTLGRDEKAICEAIAYVLRFSEIFFEAFEIDSDRANQWLFLAFLLEKEKAYKVVLRDLLDPEHSKKFLAFLAGFKAQGRDHVLKKILIAGFNAKHAKLIELERGKSKNRGILLTKEFVKHARVYVQSFMKLMGGGKFSWTTGEADDVMKYFKILIDYQNKQYYPLWLTFIGEVADAGIATAYSRHQVFETLRQGAPCWPILLTSWRFHLGERKDIRVNRAGLYSAVFHSMKGANPNEIDECLLFLVREGGPKLLMPTAKNGDEWYLPNTKEYESQFISYTTKLKGLHAQMLKSLAKV
jgi:hypothetical protein